MARSDVLLWLTVSALTTTATFSACDSQGLRFGFPGAAAVENHITIPVNAATLGPNAFGPELQISVRDSVTWTNGDTVPHSVTATDYSFDSETLAPGQSFTFQFVNAGTFSYYSKLNPSMTGSIKVVPGLALPPIPGPSPASTTNPGP